VLGCHERCRACRQPLSTDVFVADGRRVLQTCLVYRMSQHSKREQTRAANLDLNRKLNLLRPTCPMKEMDEDVRVRQ
jgi:hypothetical protein